MKSLYFEKCSSPEVTLPEMLRILLFLILFFHGTALYCIPAPLSPSENSPGSAPAEDESTPGLKDVRLPSAFTMNPAQPSPTAPDADENDDGVYDNVMKGLEGTFRAESAMVRTAKNLYLVNAGLMEWDQFYRELARMKDKMDGMQPRHFLMKVRQEIESKGGNRAVDLFLGGWQSRIDNATGKAVRTGSTVVEGKILQARRRYVEKNIQKVVQRFKGRQWVNGHEYKVFLSAIGSWPDEKIVDMKFAGDIDFNFVCGNYDLAWAMKQEFDRIVKADLGMTAQELDTVCTAHGLAEPEVYVGLHGKAFGEGWMIHKSPPLTRIELKWGSLGEKISGSEALKEMYYDFKVHKGVPMLPPSKVPKEPGISFEMLRHFTHDVMHQPVYADMDSFLKTAKYTDRSMSALEEFGLSSTDVFLADKCRELMEAKTKGVAEQTGIIKALFGELPFEVKLGPPDGNTGKSDLTIAANEKLIREFQERCKTAMWDNIELSFKHVLDGFQKRWKTLGSRQELLDFRQEVELVVKMIEVEFLLFEDPVQGMEIRPAVIELRHNLNRFYKDFMKFYAMKDLFNAKETEEYKFLKDLLSHGPDGKDGKWKLRIAMGALARWSMAGVEKVNMFLDALDDKLLGDLRGDNLEWNDFIRSAEKSAIRSAWHDWYDDRSVPLSIQMSEHTPRTIIQKIETAVNNTLKHSCMARKVKTVNLIFGESVKTSAAGRSTMKGIMAFSLANEISAYVQAFSEGDDLKDAFSRLGTEFFRQRVPFGSMVDNMYQGRYGLAAWDCVVNFIPPMALGEAAFRIGETLTQSSWKLYWTEELELLVDGFFQDAKFSLVDTHRYNQALVLGHWRLHSLTYKDQEIDLEDFEKTKREQINEMMVKLKEPHGSLAFPIQYRHEGLTGLVEVDEILKETIAESDNVLYMLKEMRKNSHAGEVLRVRLKDQWDTRWEQVKLNFILNTIEDLETRWQARQASVSGKYEQICKTLFEIAETLDIYEAVKRHLAEETGGIFYEIFQWLADFFRGTRRALMCQPEIWDFYDEATRKTITYVETYQEILAARGSAEKVFVGQNRPVDKGLRILTTSVFLSGRADQDRAAYPGWRDLPSASRDLWQQTLMEIKSECEAKSALEGPFDQRILGTILWHDVWYQLWKHANTRGTAVGEDLWQSLQSQFSPQDFPQTDPGSRKPEMRSSYLSLEHEIRHKNLRDHYVTEFKDHYQKKCRFKEDTKLLGLCSEAQAEVHRIQGVLSDAAGKSAETLFRINELTLQLRPFEESVPRILAQCRKVNADGGNLMEIFRQLRSQTLEVCRSAREVIGATPDKDLYSAMIELEKKLNGFGQNHQDIRQVQTDLMAGAQRVEKWQKSTRQLEKNIDEIALKLATLSAALQRISGEISTVLRRVATFRRSSQEQSNDDINNFPPSPEPVKCFYRLEQNLGRLQSQTQEQLKEIESYTQRFDQIKKEYQVVTKLERVKKCFEDAKAVQETVKPLLDQVGTHYEQALLCGQKAMHRADVLAGQMQEIMRQNLGQCRFDKADEVIQRMPPGDMRIRCVSDYRTAMDREARTRELAGEAGRLLAQGDIRGALVKLEQALANTICEKYKRVLQDKIRQIRETFNARLLTGLAEALTDLEGAVSQVVATSAQVKTLDGARICTELRALYQKIIKGCGSVENGGTTAARLISSAGPWPGAKKPLTRAGQLLDEARQSHRHLLEDAKRVEGHLNIVEQHKNGVQALQDRVDHQVRPKYDALLNLTTKSRQSLLSGPGGQTPDQSDTGSKIDGFRLRGKTLWLKALQTAAQFGEALGECEPLNPEGRRMVDKINEYINKAEQALHSADTALQQRTSEKKKEQTQNREFLEEAPDLLVQLKEKIRQNTQAKDARQQMLQRQNLAPSYATRYRSELIEIERILKRDKQLEIRLTDEIRIRTEALDKLALELGLLGRLGSTRH